MNQVINFPGFYGLLVGIGLLSLLGLFAWRLSKGDRFIFDPLEEKGAFEKLLSYYLDIAKLVIGLASGSIVLLVGSAALRSSGHLSGAFASPLYLLAMSILYGVVFMAIITVQYEAYRHDPQKSTYTRFKYAMNQAFGYSCLFSFCIGYIWLIVIVTAQP